MTLKNNRAPLLFHFKLCAWFRSHWWIQTWVTVRRRQIWVKFDDFHNRVTSKFDARPWKTIGHLFYATLSFVHHFVAISDFKLEIQSGNAKFGSKSTIFRAVWPWNLMCDLWKTIGHLFYATWSFVHHFVAIGEFKLEIHSGNGQFASKSIFRAVWPCNLTYDLKNNRAPLLFYFKLCASFRSHWCIQTWVTVRKRPIWVKFDDFFSTATLKFDGWPWKTIGHLFNTTSSVAHHFVAIGEIKLELQSGNAQCGSNSTIFRDVWPWYLTDDLEKQ